MRGILIDREPLQTVRHTAEQARFKHEVGGILLGCIRGDYLHVLQATPPQAADRFSFTRFWRASTGHQEIATDAWRSSNKTITYIGEWHSHPERVPVPSTIDHADWRTQIQKQERDLAFIIQGMEGLYVACGRRLGPITPLGRSVEDERSILWSPTAT